MQKLPSPSLSSRPLRENKTSQLSSTTKHDEKMKEEDPHLPGHGLPNTPHCAVRAAVCGVGGSRFVVVRNSESWSCAVSPSLGGAVAGRAGVAARAVRAEGAALGGGAAAARACVVGVALAVRVPRAGVRARGVNDNTAAVPKPARVGVVLVKESVGRARQVEGR
ncbi:hypothetical protein B0H14DRAFT_2561585 [Mycena olivaceomarginata]|nr:hypothetical protein B0H14DRAFT_2561585 [Mycena olivaceomarginata]